MEASYQHLTPIKARDGFHQGNVLILLLFNVYVNGLIPFLDKLDTPSNSYCFQRSPLQVPNDYREISARSNLTARNGNSK